MSESETRNIANHILPTSANLLGICFLIFSMVHFQDKAEVTLLDDASAVAILVFLIASLCSYVSLRSKRYAWMEKVADLTFLIGLIILATVSAFIAVHFLA